MTPTPPLAIAEDEVDRMALDIVRWGYRETARHLIAFQRSVRSLTAALEAAEKNKRTPGTVEMCAKHAFGACAHYDNRITDYPCAIPAAKCPLRTAIAAEGDAHG